MMADEALGPGAVLGNGYEIQHVASRGQFAMTYAAYDRAFGMKVAIGEYFPVGLAQRQPDRTVKVSSRHEHWYQRGLRRFVDETKILARLHHPNIVRIFRLFEENGTAYRVSELIDGASLGAWLRSAPARPTQSQMDRMFDPLIDALGLIHECGLLHQDISPATILVATTTSRPVIVDFGAAPTPVNVSREFGITTTSGFSAPERYGGDSSKQGPYSDIYSMAAVMYLAVSGEPPPNAVERSVNDTYVPLNSMGMANEYRSSFLDGVGRALQLLAHKRPQSVAEWRSILFEIDRSGTKRQRRTGSKIFISYRRADSKHVAGRVYDRLAQEFGADQVFFDVDSIPVGVDFRSHVAEAIDESVALVAIIGTSWVNKQWSIKRRWFRRVQEDFVAIELELAMHRRVAIIPLLVEGASMPTTAELPSAIKDFVYLHASPMRSGRDFKSDMDRIVDALKDLRGQKRQG